MNLRNKFSSKKPSQFRIHYEDPHAIPELKSHLLTFLPNQLPKRPIIIVCIGTDRSTGDSLGPLVGSQLEAKVKKGSDVHVYGTLSSPVHAVNLQEVLKQIESEYKNPFIIGIDACLGRLKSVGVISLGEGPVQPGAAVNKQLPSVGDFHITGIVNVSGFMEHFVLQNTRLYIVMSMANIISESLYLAIIRLKNKNRTSSTLNFSELLLNDPKQIEADENN